MKHKSKKTNNHKPNYESPICKNIRKMKGGQDTDDGYEEHKDYTPDENNNYTYNNQNNNENNQNNEYVNADEETFNGFEEEKDMTGGKKRRKSRRTRRFRKSKKSRKYRRSRKRKL